MGFFSKIFKGVKKVFKKIGKGIKGVFKGIGKFMNKIGIVGQIALMFLPLGPLIGGMMQGFGGMASTVLGKMGAIGANILKGAKFVIGKASAFAGGVRNTFRTVTQGVKTFASELTKTALNKIGFDPTKFGWKAGGSFDQWVKSGKGQSFGDAWSKVTTNITDNASKILDPFRKSVVADANTSLESLSDSTYKSVDELREMNPNIRNWDDISNKTINLDPNNIAPVKGFTPISELQPKVERSLLDYDPDLGVTGGEVKVTTPSMFDSKFTDPTSPDFIEGGSYGVLPDRTVSTITGGATDTGGGSLLSMPSLGEAATQVGVNVASQAAMGALAGDPPDYYGGELIDAGYAQVYGASQQQDFMQAAPYSNMGYRDSTGSYGYGMGNNNTYAQYMQMYGKA